jgi:hypothetical protein
MDQSIPSALAIYYRTDEANKLQALEWEAELDEPQTADAARRAQFNARVTQEVSWKR